METTPYFFKTKHGKLFGIYHPSIKGGSGSAKHGVLLCYPGVHEYNNAHWAFRRLAVALARAGFCVFRFDYYGTGDSEGNTSQGDVSIWTENIVSAAEELLELSDARHLSLVGMRFGATLAYLACGKKLKAERLILWDPVVSGTKYLEEMEHWDLGKNLWYLHPSRTRAAHDELLGYEMPAKLRSNIAECDLNAASSPNVKRVSILRYNECSLITKLASSLQEKKIDTSIIPVFEDSGGEQRGKALRPNRVLKVIEAELS